MADLNNFSKHLRKIVGPVMKAHGFKQKTNEFTRQTNNYYEIVRFQRARHIYPGEWEFFINIYFNTNPLNRKIWHFRVDKPTQISIPDYYKEYLMLDVFIRQKAIRFSEEQEIEITKYNSSKDWMYQSEDQLVLLLNEAAEIIERKVFEFFERVQELMAQNLEWQEFVKEMRAAEDKINGMGFQTS